MSSSTYSMGGSGDTVDNPGPLTQRVIDYSETIRKLVPEVKSAEDWAPLEQFVAVNEFERVGTFMEVHDWQQYTEMMTRWAGSNTKFDTVPRRVSEMPGRVFYEIEERHYRPDGRVDVVNSMTVFQFNDEDKICHLDVYLQQPRR